MNIPQFPNFRPLEKDDKVFFDEYYKKHPLAISDYTFANFYIWRKADNSQLTLINGNICPLVTTPDKHQYFMMPLGDNQIEDTMLKCLSYKPAIIRACQEFIRKYVLDNHRLSFKEDRDNFDYVYLTKDLSELRGKKYDGKRNLIKNVLKTHEYAYEPMNKSHITECLILSEKWWKIKKRESEEFPNIEHGAEVVSEAINNFEFLGLTGGVIKIIGKIEAFSMGQMLNENTAVVNIEKSDPGIKGLAQLINREFAKNAWPQTTYINREQDIGHPGLRKAKLGYHPIRLEKKFNIHLKRP